MLLFLSRSIHINIPYYYYYYYTIINYILRGAYDVYYVLQTSISRVNFDIILTLLLKVDEIVHKNKCIVTFIQIS